MRVLSCAAVLQRVASASVTVDTHLVSSIGKGVLVFAAVAAEDTRKEVESMAAKVLKMKLWPDESGAAVRLRSSPPEPIESYCRLPRIGSKAYRISEGRSFAVGDMA